MTKRPPPAAHLHAWTASDWIAAVTVAGSVLFYIARLTVDVKTTLTAYEIRLDHIENRLERLEQPAPK